MKNALILLALAVLPISAATVLTESATTPFAPDSVVSFSALKTFPCDGSDTGSIQTAPACNLPASLTIGGVTVSGSGLQLVSNASANGGAAAPIGATDWLIYVGSGKSITFTFGSGVQTAGALIDTDLGGASLTVNGVSYHYPAGTNIPYWLGASDDSGLLNSITFTAGASGFLLDSLAVQNADPLAPTADASTMVMIGTGLSLLGWMKRRRSAARGGFDMAPFRENGLFRPEHDISDDFVEIHAERQNG